MTVNSPGWLSDRKPRNPLTIHKQVLLAMTLLVALITIAFSVTLYQMESHDLMAGIDRSLFTAATMARATLPTDYHDRITGPDSVPDAQYQAIVDRYNQLCLALGMEYLWSLARLDGKIVFTSATSPDKDARHRKHAAFFEVHSNPELYLPTFERMTPTYQINDDKWGRIRVALIPFHDAHGRPYLFGASIRLDRVDAQLHQLVYQCVAGSLLVFSLSVLLGMLVADSVTRPIQRLTATIREIMQGHLDRDADERGSYEQAVLAGGFNQLKNALRDNLAELARHEEDLRITLQSIGDAVITTDTAGRITRMNPIAELLTGWSLTQAHGRALGEIFNIINIQTREPAENPVTRVLRERHVFIMAPHTALIARDGTERQIADSAAPILGPGGELHGVVMVFHDVTEQYRMQEALRESEQALRTLTDNIPDVITRLNRQLRYVYQSRNVEAVTGIPAEAFVGKRIDEMDMPGERIRLWMQTSVEILESRRPCVIEFSYPTPAGLAHFESRVIPEFDSAGAINTFLVINRDITQRKQAEAARERLEDQLRQMHKMDAVGQLAGGVAHDFNNMLTPILGYADLMLSDLPPEDPNRQSVEEILKAAASARDLTQQLLAFGRKQALELHALDLNEVIVDIKNMMRRTLREDIAIECRLDPSPRVITGDLSQLQQVVMNLLVNAQDAMPRGGRVTISTALEHLDEAAALDRGLNPGPHVVLSVADTGQGITPEVMSRIYEPFFTTKEKGRGTGLGLAMVYGVMQQHGGAIQAASLPGQGSTFRLYFPQAPGEAEPGSNSQGQWLTSQGHEVVLVVEDQDQVRDLTVNILRRHGYQVLAGAHGPAALALAEQHSGPIHLLLTDVVMPEMSGKEVYLKLSTSRPETKVLYMSGYTDNVIAHHGLLEPGVHYIAKPFTVQALAQRVRQVIDQ